MTITEVAKEKDKILRPDYQVFCKKCGERFYSPFDKMFILVQGDCVICNEEDDNLTYRLSENINKILEQEK